MRIAMVPKDYPDRKRSKSEAKELKGIMTEEILSLQKDTKEFTFRGALDRDEAVMFSCTNEKIEVWLRNRTTEETSNGIQMKTLKINKLLKCHMIVVHAEEPTGPAGRIIAVLGRQNEDPQFSNCVITKGSERNDSTPTSRP
ncbi:hypothetical protein KM043_014379 [Ampulex compressa]|nr:hypothetical protein KM043_014379 [Ampulex compressa]